MPEARTVSTSSFRSTSRGAGDSSAVGDPLLAQQVEHDPQLLLGGSPDLLDRLERTGRLLGPPRHEPPSNPGLDGDDRQSVRDDVVQLLGDAHPLLADLLAGAFGLRWPARVLPARGGPPGIAAGPPPHRPRTTLLPAARGLRSPARPAARMVCSTRRTGALHRSRPPRPRWRGSRAVWATARRRGRWPARGRTASGRGAAPEAMTTAAATTDCGQDRQGPAAQEEHGATGHQSEREPRSSLVGMRPQREDDRGQANQGGKDDDRQRPAFVEGARHLLGRASERWITGTCLDRTECVRPAHQPARMTSALPWMVLWRRDQHDWWRSSSRPFALALWRGRPRTWVP